MAAAKEIAAIQTGRHFRIKITLKNGTGRHTSVLQLTDFSESSVKRCGA